MKIVLDTNILCQDYFFEKPHFRTLFEGAFAVPLEIHIPEVVCDETVNRYREDLEDALESFDKSSRTLSSLSKVEHNAAIDVSAKVVEYKRFLENYLKERGVAVEPYPDIPHKRIVERDLSRKKPFKRNGSGYRDTLIWENVKRVMGWGSERIVFITNNPRDFGEGPIVDTDLQDEIRNADRLKICRSLKYFNDEFVVPKLEKLEQVKIQLQHAKLERFSLQDWLRENLKDLLRNYDLEEVLAGFPNGVGSAWVTEIVEFREIEVKDVRALQGENRLITVFIEFDGKCSIDSDWDDFVKYSEVREFWGEDGEEFSSIGAFFDETIRLTVDLVVTGNEMDVDSEEIVSISADYGDIDFGGWR